MNNFSLRRAPAIGLALVMTTLCGLVSLPTQAQVAKPALVRDIDDPALQPFRITQFCGSVNNASVITCQPATVPAGKRLVIEFVGFYADGGNQDPVVSFRLRVGGQSSNNGFFMVAKPSDFVLQAGGVSYNVAYNQLVKLDFEAGETIEVNAFYINNTNSQKNFQINLQGYFVNLP